MKPYLLPLLSDFEAGRNPENAWWMKKYMKDQFEFYGIWMNSGNIWFQRTCLLFQLNYKKNTDTEILFRFIEQLSGESLFWIRKAIGWVLREYSKTNPAAVLDFLSV